MAIFPKNLAKIKRNFLSFALLSLIFFLFPLPTLAFWETLKNAVLAVPYLIVSVILIFFVILTGVIAFVTGWILDVVISPSFLSLGYTNPATNPIIRNGLSITQSFVNLILVLVLVYSALAIALRINEAGAKRTLARIIIVALLVNFAPLFCGLVVDGANIVMNFFLAPIQEGVTGWLSQVVGVQIDSIKAYIFRVGTQITEALGAIMMGFVQIIINLSLAVAFLLFAVIFLFRYIAIWILVILSPIAFAAWAVSPVGGAPEREIGFPFANFISAIASGFGAFWDRWLKEFINWSIIGIPLAFFLYLSVSSFNLLVEEFKAKIEMPGIEAQAIGYFNEVFPYFVITGLLYLGFIFGLQTNVALVDNAIKGIKEARKRGIQLTSRGVYAGVGAPAKGVWEGIKTAVSAGVASYRLAKSSGVSGGRALFSWGIPAGVGALGAYTTRKIRATPQAMKRAAKGIWSGIRDVAETGLIGAGILERKPKERPTCSVCGNYVPPGSKNCPHCGAPMPTCPQCGTLAVSGERFCRNCGAKLPKV
jgi:hypothetical protein